MFIVQRCRDMSLYLTRFCCAVSLIRLTCLLLVRNYGHDQRFGYAKAISIACLLCVAVFVLVAQLLLYFVCVLFVLFVGLFVLPFLTSFPSRPEVKRGRG